MNGHVVVQRALHAVGRVGDADTVRPMWSARRTRREWLRDWEAVVASRVHHWGLLDDGERRRLGERIEWLVRTKHWEAARGFALTQEMVLTVAANAGLLVLNIDRDAYRDVRAIVLHPGTITHRGVRSTTMPGVVTDGPMRVLGHARGRRGPIVISWRAVQADARGRGSNVVLHEFAHKTDAVDGLFDGTPEILDRSERAEWIRVCTTEFRRLRRRRSAPDPVLRPYARENPSEFFAVATEAFFERPVELRSHHLALYGVLGGYYAQDPAHRRERAEAGNHR